MLIACMQNKMKNKDKKYIKRSLKYLAPLTQVPKKYKSSIVPLLSDDCIHKICESCQNLLQNTYGFDKRKLNMIRKKLSTSTNDLRIFSKPSSSLLSKRKILASEQTGAGIFSLLASTIIPALISAVAK